LRRWGGAAGGDRVPRGGGVVGTGEFGRRPKMVLVTEEPMARHPRRAPHARIADRSRDNATPPPRLVTLHG
jgi:hypothetical protein